MVVCGLCSGTFLRDSMPPGEVIFGWLDLAGGRIERSLSAWKAPPCDDHGGRLPSGPLGHDIEIRYDIQWALFVFLFSLLLAVFGTHGQGFLFFSSPSLVKSSFVVHPSLGIGGEGWPLANQIDSLLRDIKDD